MVIFATHLEATPAPDRSPRLTKQGFEKVAEPVVPTGALRPAPKLESDLFTSWIPSLTT